MSQSSEKSSEKNNEKRLYLIDGYSNIFRAFYAIRGLSSSSGEPTNAVFGFVQMLKKLLRDENPHFVGVALDVSSDTVRKERYEDYKANRAPMPEDLRPQIPRIRQALEAFRIPILELEKYEADDVLGTLAKKAAAAGYEVVLVSPDKDLFQLVGDGVSLYHTGREKLYDAALVEEDFGVPPEKVVDVLALMGDASDNVPGVKGIGEKGAKKLIEEYGTLDNLLEKAGEIKRKSYREGLQEHREDAVLSKELVTIHTDLPVPFEPDELVHEKPDHQKLLELFWELDFKSLADEVESEYGLEGLEVEPATPLESGAAWRELSHNLGEEIHLAAIGDDGDAVGPPLGVAVLDANGAAQYADFGRDEVKAAVLETLRAWLADPALTLVGHDLKEVVRAALSGEERLRVRCRLIDTMLASYLLMTELRSHAFTDLVYVRLRRKAITPQEAGWAKGQKPSPRDPVLLAYAAERVALPAELARTMRGELAEAGLSKVYEEIEEPLVPVLAEMEEKGIELDVDYLSRMSEELQEEIGVLEGEIYEIAGERFNINSPKQLGEIMFERLGYPVLGRTRKTKSYSTSADTLEALAARGFDLPQKLIAYREAAKLQSTYVEALPALVAADGRLHTRFNQAVAATGRLSSAHPNLQNIPIRTEVGQRIRKAFRAAPGHLLVVADYSQIELRILAHIAEEQAMIDAFKRGEDIHAATAGAVLGVAPLLVNPEQRRMAKVINFGIIYGMSAFGLAKQLGITRKEADHFIKAYMERYPGVARYTEKTVEEARESLRVATLYGRVRTLPDIRSRNYNLRENAKRMAINARIQGTAADLMKLAMIAVDRRLREDEPAARLLLTVHDELVLEAPEASAESVAQLVETEMEGVAELTVPLEVEAGVGKDWYEAKG